MNAKSSSHKTFQLGRFVFHRPVLLAPMSGVTDLPFRRIAAGFAADLVVTEMVASESFGKGDEEMSLRAAGEGIAPHVVQLAGREARWMGEAARMAEANGADIIDINMGCPARRVTTGWSGAALMRDLDHALTLIEATVAAVAVPVTLTMRLGWDRATINAPELARRAEAAGVQMVTVHGRTRDQFYEGHADWGAIRAVREAIAIPLIANGDVRGFDDADTILSESGADGVMVGRGACGRPWLPGALSRYLASGERWHGPEVSDLIELVIAHHAALVDQFGPVKGVLAARKHLGWYIDAFAERMRVDLKAVDEVAGRRRALCTATDPVEIAGLIASILTSLFEAQGTGHASTETPVGIARLVKAPPSKTADFSTGKAA